ncbi:MAG: tetratricopeptide repeat protein, partial [Myxococcota bacterium]|nr:tetratricopeptide repeat protein [Myxococcota bacterium]
MADSERKQGSLIDGRYRVEETLGSGGMGVVLRATDLHMMGQGEGSEVAVKLLSHSGLRRAFISEFQIQRRLAHPAFPRAHRLGRDGISGALYTVQGLCRLGPATPTDDRRADAGMIAAGLLRALDHLHRNGYVHGDLSPHNVRLGSDGSGTVNILDLGAAGAIGSGEGQTSGVLGYQAPERLEGAPRSPEADLWAVGAVIFGLVHGRHPFPEYPERTDAANEGPGETPSTSELDPWLLRLLQRSPGDRFSTATAALESLAEVVGQPLESTPPEEVLERLRRLPFLDVDDHLSHTMTRLREAAEAKVPQSFVVSGPAGSGRSRLLQEIGERLLGEGVHCTHARALVGDRPGDLWRRLGEQFNVPVDGPWTETTAVATSLALLASIRQQGRPIALIVDDVRRMDATSQVGLNHLRETISRFPDRAEGLLLVTTGDGGDVSLSAWSPEQIRALVESALPGRRLESEAGQALLSRSHGLISVLCPLLSALGQREAVSADATNIRLKPGAIEDAELPDSLESAAATLLSSLSEGAQREAALIGHALSPPPSQMLGDAAAELAVTGATLRVGSQGGDLVTLATPALVMAAREGLPEEEALRIWGDRWRKQGDDPTSETEAHAYALALGTEEALSQAREAALMLAPAFSARWIHQIIDAQWPAGPTACLAAGLSAASAGDLRTAETLFRRGSKPGDLSEADAARCLVELGEQLGHQARHGEALTTLERYLTANDAGDTYRSRALVASARSAALTGNHEGAASFVNRAREGDHLDGRQEGELLYVEGLTAYYSGRLEEARTLLDRARRAGEENDDLVSVGASITALGLVAHQAGDPVEASTHYREALEVGERSRDGARVLTALQNLGVVQQESGQYIQALSSYGEAHQLATALGQTGRQAQLGGNLGVLWCYLGELDKAREVLERELSLSRQEQNRFLEGIALAMLGEVALAQESWTEASQHLTEAISALQDSGAVMNLAETRLAMTRLYLERQDYGLARKIASDVLTHCRDSGNQSLEVQALGLLGAAHARSVHGDPEQAKLHLNEACERIHQVTTQDARWPIWLEIFHLSARTDDTQRQGEAAEEVRRLLRQLEDQVPSAHRVAFRTLRDRQRAWWFTTGRQQTPVQSQEVSGTAQAEHWNRLIEVNKRISGEQDQDRLLEYIMDSAVLLSGAERGFLLLPKEGSKGKVEIRVARNLDQENIRKNRMKISHSIATRVLETGEEMLTVDAMEDERYRDQLSVHDLKLRSVLCLPMRAQGQVLGAIYLDNRFRTSAFDHGVNQRMSAFADQAAIALYNARLLTEMTASQRALEEARAEVESLNQQL